MRLADNGFKAELAGPILAQASMCPTKDRDVELLSTSEITILIINNNNM